ncbi:unnamed protein product [Rotaria sp. Silwood1]|nr:unnamed protein product [Rotaria sp. Silwood1]
MQTGFPASLNRALRAKDRHELKPWFGFLKLFITALNKLPSVQTTIWRGVNTDVTFSFIENKLEIWWTVNSCSRDLDAIQSYLIATGTIFNIQVINGKDIRTYSAFKDENEIILVPGTHLRVKSTPFNHKNSLFLVHLEEENSQPASKIQRVSLEKCKFDIDQYWPLLAARIDFPIVLFRIFIILECQYSDGGRYQGEFRNGKRHGYGVYYYPNKEEWAGKWLNDQTNGRGIRTFPDGSRYEGEEKNAKKHGYGTYCFPNGDIYDGEWVNDKQNGRRTFIKPEGIQYNGYFRNNLKHGYGKMKYADGKIKEGYWKDDKFIDRS